MGLENTLVFFFALLFGLMWGSFLAALVYRIPHDKAFKLDRSHCPHCNALISWFHNLPLISFFILRGRCASCSAKISWQYPLIEGLSGCLFVLIAYRAPEIPELFFLSAFVSLGLLIIFIDFNHKIIPNEINLVLALIMGAYSFYRFPLLYGLQGLAVGGGATFFVSYLYFLWRKKIGLGGGDIKLFAGLGLFLGPIGIIENIFLSSFSGALIGGLFQIAIPQLRGSAIPFGPFIVISAFVQIFFQAELVRTLKNSFLVIF